MEILVLILALLALDILANAVGPDSRDLESALRTERVPIRRDAWLAARPDDSWSKR
ncbi:MAG TPA: hypothetical protein VFM93_08680 [Candidatus Limnocylindria bacterium]|nr:hypothetical protein [Candidatus Limnocylindria bacterium]